MRIRREAWFTLQPDLDPTRLVFLDETGATTKMSRLRGRAPPTRLAATGFGEFQPIDDRGDEIAYRRNRRIEFKLTQR